MYDSNIVGLICGRYVNTLYYCTCRYISACAGRPGGVLTITNVWILGTCRAIVDGQKKCIWILYYIIYHYIIVCAWVVRCVVVVCPKTAGRTLSIICVEHSDRWCRLTQHKSLMNRPWRSGEPLQQKHRGPAYMYVCALRCIQSDDDARPVASFFPDTNKQ